MKKKHFLLTAMALAIASPTCKANMDRPNHLEVESLPEVKQPLLLDIPKIEESFLSAALYREKPAQFLPPAQSVSVIDYLPPAEFLPKEKIADEGFRVRPAFRGLKTVGVRVSYRKRF